MIELRKESEQNKAPPKKARPSPSTLRIGKRYRPNRADRNYDVIVIGSGPGGLSVAASLSKVGKKVLVLEQHYTAGGFTHAYARNGYEWDVGVHLINDVGRENHICRKVYDYITNSELQWAELQEEVVTWKIDGKPDVGITLANNTWMKALKESFPEESENIDNIFKYAAKIAFKTLPALLIKKTGRVGAINRLIGDAAFSIAPKDAFRPSCDVLRDFTKNEYLIQIICTWASICGHTSDDVPFVFIAASLLNRNRFCFPVGGSSRIAETVIPVIQESGGDLLTYAMVDEILISDNRAMGVRMADNHEIYAPAVVSCAGVFNTFRHLVPENVSKEKGYLQRLTQVERTTAHFNMFIGMNDSNSNLSLHSGHLMCAKNLDIDNNTRAFNNDLTKDFPFLFITFPSAKDPDWDRRYPGKSTCSIIIYISNFKHFEQWRHQQWEKRGADYDQLKEEMAERIFKILYEHYPQLKGKVDYYELSTPLSTRFFCMYEHGEAYGIHHTAKRFRQDWLKPKTSIPGLYLTGQDVLTVGHTPSALSGVLTASQLLGWRDKWKLWRGILSTTNDGPSVLLHSEDSKCTI